MIIMRKAKTNAHRLLALAKKCDRKPPMPRPQIVESKKTYNRAKEKAKQLCY